MLTLPSATSYPRSRNFLVPEPAAIRFAVAIATLAALTACATDTASLAEVTQLRDQVRALHERNDRLAGRLQRLETRVAVSDSAEAPAPVKPDVAPTVRPASADASGAGAPAAAAEAAAELPELTVIKLRPRRSRAPRLATDVQVVEPDTDDVEAFVAAQSGATAEPELPEVDPAILDARFDAAVAGLRTGDIEGSAATLQRFAQEHPKHPRSDNALYLSGLGLAGLKEWKRAAALFEDLIDRYPAGDAVLDAMLRLAECRARLAQPDLARALYTRVLTQFPGTAAATQAEQRLAALSK